MLYTIPAQHGRDSLGGTPWRYEIQDKILTER